MSGILLGSATVGGGGMSFDGLFSTSGAGPTVTSVTRTISGAGTLLFDAVNDATGTPQYSKNGGAWTAITEGATLAMSNTNTLAVRGIDLAIGESVSFNIKDNLTGALIQAATVAANS